MRKFRDLRPFRRPERSFPLVMIGRRIGRGAFRQVCYRLGFRMPARRDASEGRQSTSEPTGGAFASASPSRGRHLMVGRGLEGGAGACLNRLVCSGRLPLREAQRAVATMDRRRLSPLRRTRSPGRRCAPGHKVAYQRRTGWLSGAAEHSPREIARRPAWGRHLKGGRRSDGAAGRGSCDPRPGYLTRRRRSRRPPPGGRRWRGRRAAARRVSTCRR